jgi:hypothetical protein
MSASYPTKTRRTALAPAILAAIALLVGVAIITTGGFIVIRYVVSILALIVTVFAWQARQWWWIIGLVPIAVLWNPIFPIDLGQPDLWLGLQYLAVLVFLAAGILIKITDGDNGGLQKGH